jgi:hypothetical protein
VTLVGVGISKKTRLALRGGVVIDAYRDGVADRLGSISVRCY